MVLRFYNLLNEWDMIYFSPHLSTNKMKLTGAPGDFEFTSVKNKIQNFVDTDFYVSFWVLSVSINSLILI